ncbi:MAG: YceI family protein [Bacteroidota bacterium]
MKLLISFVIGLGLSLSAFSQNIYACKDDTCKFFSETPVEDIKATSTRLIGAMNLSTNDIVFQVPMRSFRFKKSLMEEHFNENYMESDKYPKGTFKGKLLTPIDLSTPGTYPVKAKGTFEVHGVAQEREFEGTVQVFDDKTYRLTSVFMVKLVDHDIKVPKIVIKSIAEEIEVTMIGNFAPREKK